MGLPSSGRMVDRAAVMPTVRQTGPPTGDRLAARSALRHGRASLEARFAGIAQPIQPSPVTLGEGDGCLHLDGGDLAHEFPNDEVRSSRQLMKEDPPLAGSEVAGDPSLR